MSDPQNNLFRKKALDRISSPDQLTDYLRVTTPGIWVILLAVIVLLAGLLAWSAVGTIETKSDAKVIVKNNSARVITLDGSEIKTGMPLRLVSKDYVIASCEEDTYGRSVGITEVSLPDGSYDGVVITETIHPISFLLESR